MLREMCIRRLDLGAAKVSHPLNPQDTVTSSFWAYRTSKQGKSLQDGTAQHPNSEKAHRPEQPNIHNEVPASQNHCRTAFITHARRSSAARAVECFVSR
jgi:hypothetical protein